MGCRRQLGGIVRLILYDFVKIPQSFFCFQKNDSSLYKGAFVGQGQALSLRLCVYFNMIFSRELHIILTINGGSKPPPYIIRYTIQFVRITDFCGFRAQEYFCTIVFNFTRIINFQQQKGELCSHFSF